MIHFANNHSSEFNKFRVRGSEFNLQVALIPSGKLKLEL